MKRSRLTILKIGGSCITYKDQSKAHFRRGFLARMAHEIALSIDDYKNQPLIIVHGGGAMTHPLLDYYHLSNKLKNEVLVTKQEKISAAKIHVVMNELNNKIVRALQDAGIPAWPIQTSAIAVSLRGNTSDLFVDAIRAALKLGVVPVLHGDLILDNKKGSQIFSGDVVACMLSRDLDAQRLLFMSDVNGVYDSVQNIEKKTIHLNQFSANDLQAEKFILDRVSGIDHSGGMREKIRCIKDICSHADVRIFSGLINGNINKALRGESVGTKIIY